jgi:hypothetical protein
MLVFGALMNVADIAQTWTFKDTYLEEIDETIQRIS